MKLKLDIAPDIAAMMAAEIAAGERAVTAAVKEAGAGLKSAWRGQIVGAGLGPRLANSIRSQLFPKSGESLRAAALTPDFGQRESELRQEPRSAPAPLVIQSRWLTGGQPSRL
ncbi:MAG TPA: DUF6441 family protein [Xanthobacteraceae bacterium]|nr:DUF6441 family protein [Xanthobacteraceae bacterium]